MSEEWAEQPASPAVPGHPGAQLAAQREALGWTVEQVAEQLKLARRQIIALEAGDYAALPGTAVVRGFIRAYAKVVKLDAAPLVAMIEPDPPEPAEPAPVRREKQPAFSEVRFPTNGDRPFPFGWLIGAVVLAGVAFGAYQFGFVPARVQQAPAPIPAPAAAEPAAPAPSDKPLEPPVQSTTLLKADQELSDVNKASAPLVSAPAAVAAPAAPVPAPAAAPGTANALVFNVRQESWIEVRKASNNAVLLSRLAKAGTTETVDVTEPVNIVVGKPGDVDATLRGAALELKPATGATTARLKVK